MNGFGKIPDIGLLDREKLYSLSIYFVEIIKFLIQIAIAFNPGNIFDTCIFQSDSDMIKSTAFLLCVLSKQLCTERVIEQKFMHFITPYVIFGYSTNILQFHLHLL